VNIQVAVAPVLGLAHITSVAPAPLKSPAATRFCPAAFGVLG
jgi:hypothetical protein